MSVFSPFFLYVWAASWPPDCSFLFVSATIWPLIVRRLLGMLPWWPSIHKISVTKETPKFYKTILCPPYLKVYYPFKNSSALPDVCKNIVHKYFLNVFQASLFLFFTPMIQAYSIWYFQILTSKHTWPWKFFSEGESSKNFFGGMWWGIQMFEVLSVREIFFCFFFNF